ncbi:MAG: 3-hydroxyacyl-CoA dehydrogenase family protein [Candidatus Eremiobacteraeota bacterium]|nr:3-hydroxyacyl-CoA dehydrogenase family protein [Candidatus Eremiobacteraeota bacterium]
MENCEIKTVGIVGCGLMGSGWAQLCVSKGYRVIVAEQDQKSLERGLAIVKAGLESTGGPGGREAAEEKIRGTLTLDDMAACDVVVETIPEKMYLKKKVFIELDRVCADHAVLATNTSVLSVLDIAKATRRPERVLGFNTNPLIFPIAEIIETIVLAPGVLEAGRKFMVSLDKEVIIVKDSPGFILNRLITSVVLNSIRLVESGIASAHDIDRVITVSLGWKTGPLALADTIGLDTVLFGATSLYHDLNDPQFAPPLILKKMVTAGLLGKKSGKGFFDYPRSSPE